MKNTNNLFQAIALNMKKGLKGLFLAGAIVSGAISSSSAQLVTIPGLIHQYCLDNNANDGVGTLHGIVMGATPTTDRYSSMNHAYEFNGVSDFIDLPDDVWVSGDFSVSGWLYIEGGSGWWPRFFEFGNGVDQDNVFFSPSMSGSGQPVVGLHECGTFARDYAVAPAPISLMTWHHIVVTLQSSLVTVYLDNAVWYTFVTAYPPCAVTRTENYFGKSNFPADDYFHGKIDDVFIFDRALTPSEVNDLYRVQSCGSVMPRLKEAHVDNVTEAVEQSVKLGQNIPNPFSSSTTIQYELPAAFHNASLQISDVTGRLVKTIKLSNEPAGSVTIHSNDLMSGVYTYVLNVDGKVTDRKKMILSAQ